MECISSPSFQVLWNGGCSETFNSERGLRQGCPLSPYIFTLCVERLSILIRDCVVDGSWKAVELAKGSTKLSHIFFADDLVLFGVATVAQATVIQKCLDDFGGASGQRVSKEKSRIYFSKNVSSNLQREISGILGMPTTTNLGRYLGVPIIHGRALNAHYKFLLENLDSKLAGWKRETLSLAGRVTLAVSVLNAMPSYAMQTAVLSDAICDKIDQRIRSFVWGAEAGKRKLHLVKWEEVCKPKEMGGLGLRSAKALNQAYLLKLAWGLLKNPTELWAEVLLTKYFHRRSEGLVPRATKRFSALWRGIKEVWQFLNLGMQWGIKNGRNTKFWSEKWIDSGQILQEVAIRPEVVDLNLSVTDFCREDGTWNSDMISACLPSRWVNQVLGMNPPHSSLGEDTPTWGLEGKGNYTVKSGYALIKEHEQGSLEDKVRWTVVWKWPGPNKIRHFLWLVSHNRLLTNLERRRRHLANADFCVSCSSQTETIDHVFRQCPIAVEVWRELVPPSELRSFFSQPFDEWWVSNLKKEDGRVRFGIACWRLWLHRNDFVFNGNTSGKVSVVAQINYWTNLVVQAHDSVASLRSQSSATRVRELISWQPEADPWLTLNTDGSVDREGRASAGGAIRDAQGNLILAYSTNLGGCSITRAELRGILEGMNLAWNCGVRKLMIQTDSACAIQLLRDMRNYDHQHASLMLQFEEMLKHDWEVKMQHIYREGNFLADHLANIGHLFPFGLHLIDSSTPAVAHWIAYDRLRSSQPRLVLRTL
ncbi:Putative ribonuclease H protein At1g65750 [Linum perenne]